jgi:formylglycine-generating enzyme required for sulfatase activity
MTELKRPLNVFLCHAHSDAKAVHTLYDRLIGDGVDAWLDKEKLIGGQDWEYEIRKSVRESDVVVVCLSQQFSQKGFRQYEVRIALEEANLQPEGEIFIIPLRLEECNVPQSLRRWHWVDLFESDGYERLMRALQARANRIGATLQVKKSWLPKITSPRPKMKKPIEARKPVDSDRNEIKETQDQEKTEREAAHRLEREKAEREAAESAKRERSELEAAEKAKRDKVERHVTQINTLEKIIFSIFAEAPKSSSSRKVPFFRIFGAVGIIIILFWIGSWYAPKIYEAISITKASTISMDTPTSTTTSTNTTISIRTSTVAASQTTIPLAKVSCIYTIQPGDFLVGIAQKFGINNFENISCAPDSPNCNLANETLIYAGWRVVIPRISSDICITQGGELYDPSSNNFPNEITDLFGVAMRLVPASEFIMGSDKGEIDEKPFHYVYLEAYYIDKYEMTNEFYSACVDAGICEQPKKTNSDTRDSYYGNSMYSDYPVIYVDWNMAKTYCEWREAQLPTEAQWEKASRGTDGRTYPWGEDIDKTYANYDNNADGDTTAVGSYEKGKSIYGVYDMAGNVWEWVTDWYSENYYQNSPPKNPSGPDTGKERVMRGGAWDYFDEHARASDRQYDAPSSNNNSFGFRCARDATP